MTVTQIEKKNRQDIKLQFEGSFSPPTMPVRLKQELSDPTNILPWFIPLMDTRNTLNSFQNIFYTVLFPKIVIMNLPNINIPLTCEN